MYSKKIVPLQKFFKNVLDEKMFFSHITEGISADSA